MQYRAIRSLSAVVLSATLLALSSTASAQQKFINILTGGQSGVYYPLGVALGQIYGKAIPDAQDQRAVHQGLGREPEPAADGPGRNRFHAWRCALGRLERRGRSRLQGAARRSCASSPASTRTTSRSSPASESGIKTLADLKGKRHVGGRAEVGHRAERAGDFEGGRASPTRTSPRSSTCRSANRSS